MALMGPRQSGKTTLARRLWPRHAYASLESLDLRERATSDPRGFLRDLGDNVLLDEVQRCPGLFSYLQEWLDEEGHHAVLTGSQQFHLSQAIGQSLAGRVAHFELYPFTWAELSGRPDTPLAAALEGNFHGSAPERTTESILHAGGYPRIHDRGLNPHRWLDDYLRTYVERDLRELSQVADLAAFVLMLRLLAGQAGSLLNTATLATQVGVSLPTIRRWIGLLETSGIIFLLQPHHANYGKRLLKTPKPYFVDSGLHCLLLGIRTPEQILSHPLRGHIFENFLVSELWKGFHHRGHRPALWFWRDSHGLEVDVLIEDGNRLVPLEIKSSATWKPDLETGIRKWLALSGQSDVRGFVLYDGDHTHGVSGPVTTVPWWRFV